MPQLRDKENCRVIGKISDEQLQFLVDHLEEESSTDQDYYLNQATLDMLEEAGADSELIDMLSKALENREGIEIEWF